MSKKRKTRKQKEEAQKRQLLSLHVHEVEAPVYSIPESVKPLKAKATKIASIESKEDKTYLKKDMATIIGASGIILAFDILLFVLLTTGTIKLGFLGY